MTSPADMRRNPVEDRDGLDARIARAKRISDNLAKCMNSAGALVMPAELKAALGDAALLFVELAQLAHAKFETYPFDLKSISQRLDALDGLAGEGAMPALVARVSALERSLNENGIPPYGNGDRKD